VPFAEGPSLFLMELNLVSAGIPTAEGASGVLGLKLEGREEALSYDPKTGRATGEFILILHYELLDERRGFIKGHTEGEMDAFAPRTETMRGRLSMRFPHGLQPAPGGRATAEITSLEMRLSSPILGVIEAIRLSLWVRLDWNRSLAPAAFLRIQPVFIGRDSSDPNATGRAFPQLMKRAVELWERCGSVRCVKFAVNRPIYLDRPAYRILESEAEAASLRGEVDVVDAVEVFVVERMEFACSWGGGACFSSGTAAAKVVTCDQQLETPSPCPGYCPATCPTCPPCREGEVNYYHLAHELGHVLNLSHPHTHHGALVTGTPGSNMEPSGLCCDNPGVQSAHNCRSASNPLFYWGRSTCRGDPDIDG
ncbi:MAG: hypothetical protein GXO72_06235, partial [Caldiserica bacterium]|nr:hypothetical protein [Caldisericota bacterium]